MEENNQRLLSTSSVGHKKIEEKISPKNWTLEGQTGCREVKKREIDIFYGAY